MSFSNMEMIHLYIYFKQENAKKNLYFFFSVAFAVFVLRKTQLAENYYQGGMPLSEVMCILGKNSILGCFWELSC
jgi:hypothetical protein